MKAMMEDCLGVENTEQIEYSQKTNGGVMLKETDRRGV